MSPRRYIDNEHEYEYGVFYSTEIYLSVVNITESTFVMFWKLADCYDFNVTVSGATDTRVNDSHPIVYSFFDEIPFTVTKLYTCDYLWEEFRWIHIRLIHLR